MKYLKLFFVFTIFLPLSAADLGFYLGEDQTYNPDIPTPKSVLGFEVGEWHVRHDLLERYMREVAEASDRIQLVEIGRTHENRALLHLIITAPANHSRLEELRAQHLDAVINGSNKVAAEDRPIVVNLGYSVHGNEPSGSNAAPLVAYHLAAAQNIDDLLNNTIIILDPCLNPDGLSRFAQWANMHKGKNLVADSAHREHAEGWPSGRTNHYWFDLNRDWLLLVHPSSRARVEQFHRWRPNILTDHHEMGTGSTFFFQPGIPSRRNPLTPVENEELTRDIAKFHAAAFNEQGVLYYSEQSFDDFYYGKGSTYPDAQGTIGILFEQASSRGHLQENTYGKLTFPQTIKNQVTTSFSTLKAAMEHRVKILEFQREFNGKARQEASKDKVKAYAFGTGSDEARGHELVNLLLQHQIEVHRLAKPVQANGADIKNGYIIKTDQNQYRLIKSMFAPVTSFNDNTFYDVSAWHMPSAYWADYAALDAKSFQGSLVGERITKSELPTSSVPGGDTPYAYILDWRDYYAPRAVYDLLDAGLKLRFATDTFTIDTRSGSQSFKQGAIMIPMGVQDVDASAVSKALKMVAERDGVTIHAADNGLTAEGIDMGSPNMNHLPKPKPLLLVDGGVSQYEAGEIWHLVDQRFDMPLTMVEQDRLGRVNLDDYTHLIMVNGRYSLGENRIEDIKEWVRGGGVLIATKGAARFVQQHKLIPLKVKTAQSNNANGKKKAKEEPVEFLPYGDRARIRALQFINGTVFQAQADLTHPIAYGVEKDVFALFRNSTLFLEPSKDPYATAVRYTGTPLISGYVSKENLDIIKNSAAVIAQGVGRGAVVVMVDNPNFRGFWYGPNRLFANALFFGSAIR